MKYKKSHYIGMIIEGHKWSGYWDGFHHFTMKCPQGYSEVRVIDADIEDGSAAWFIQHDLTR